MNNAKIIESFSEPEQEQQEISPDQQIPWLRAREGELVKIIEAIKQVESSEAWSTLKTHVLDGVLESLERRISSEASAKEVNPAEMYRLQGQIAWAKKYANLDTLTNAFRLELTSIRQKLNGQ